MYLRSDCQKKLTLIKIFEIKKSEVKQFWRFFNANLKQTSGSRSILPNPLNDSGVIRYALNQYL